MEGNNVHSLPEESMEQAQDSSPEVASLSRRLESLENSMRYLEDNMMTRLSALEERVEVLMRRIEGFNNDLSGRWSPVVSLEVPTVSTDASTMLPTTIPARQKNKQGILTARRVQRRYQRLVKSNWDDKSPLRRVMRNLERKKRQRS